MGATLPSWPGPASCPEWVPTGPGLPPAARAEGVDPGPPGSCSGSRPLQSGTLCSSQSGAAVGLAGGFSAGGPVPGLLLSWGRGAARRIWGRKHLGFLSRAARAWLGGQVLGGSCPLPPAASAVPPGSCPGRVKGCSGWGGGGGMPPFSQESEHHRASSPAAEPVL